MKNIALLAMLFVMASSSAIAADPIVTESTASSTVTTNGKMETTVKSPPPSAMAPMINASNSDLCTVGVAGAVQTQILGISGGTVVRDMNCERLKNAKTLYDMGMKVAAVSVMCQDSRIYNAMEQAGTPCPYNGKIGKEAADLWEANPDKNPNNVDEEEKKNDTLRGWLYGFGTAGLLLLLL